MAVPGTYIAHGKWLDCEFGPDALYKVGHTGDLGRRLEDSGYVTCFPPGHWSYAATFELPTKDQAYLLETAVLHCCREYRLGPRELVNLPLATILGIAEAAASKMALTPVKKMRPAYPPPAKGIAKPREEAPLAEPKGWVAGRKLVESLSLCRPAIPEPADGLIDDLLSLDWGALAAEPRLAPPPMPKKQPALLPPKPSSTPSDEQELEAQDALEGVLTAPLDLARLAKLEEREYQTEAIVGCLRELKATGKTILQMACRSGKTPVAYQVMRSYLSSGCVLYLVPGLALLRQTAQKLTAYGYEGELLLVGSDPRPVRLATPSGGREAQMTTDPALIHEFCKLRSARLVISTYQSSELLLTEDGPFGPTLTVFDEAHRVCGGDAVRPFNAVLLTPLTRFRSGARLFMTATPAYEKLAISMKDTRVFGGVAYRYHLRQAIDAGYVNDFQLQLVAAPAGRPSEDPLPSQIMAAMNRVAKLLVFCRDINHCTRLCEAVRALSEQTPVPFDCLVAHSRMHPQDIGVSMQKLAALGTRAALFSVRMLQEGVEVPALNGIFFAAPRHSPRDIIQSLCRPLNKMEGKPMSMVFIPVTCNIAEALDSPENLKKFASIVPVIDALLEEDARLYEHLLDPSTPYPIELLGTHTLKLPPERKKELLAAVRRAVRYGTSTAARPVERLLRTENVPWLRAFAEIKRIVLSFNRYPKTTDAWVVGETSVCLHRFYRWAATEYENWRDGRPSKLEPHQVADLESLPMWTSFGVNGPYWWKPCMEYLEKWLEDHEGVPPEVEINIGGWVGLDASMMERLSGSLTCINQQCFGKKGKDGKVKTACRVPKEHQDDLDRICGRFGLRWRKVYLESGVVDTREKTFIQSAFARFKKRYKENGAKDPYIMEHFKDYPQKHLKQESLEVQQAKSAPPRWKSQARAKRDAC